MFAILLAPLAGLLWPVVALFLASGSVTVLTAIRASRVDDFLPGFPLQRFLLDLRHPRLGHARHLLDPSFYGALFPRRGILYGIGYGAYYAVDWALACDVLPNREEAAGRDMALWHVSFTLPQVLAPAILAGFSIS